MRLSVLDKKFNFDKYKNVKVYLDGEFVESCITADEEKGYICAYTKPYKVLNDIVETYEKYGKVEIKL